MIQGADSGGTDRGCSTHQLCESNRNAYQKRKHRKRIFRNGSKKACNRRSAIVQMRKRKSLPPVFGHQKQDHRMASCYLKGHLGSCLNAYLAAAAWNFKMKMRELSFCLILRWLYQCFCQICLEVLHEVPKLDFKTQCVLSPTVSF